MAEPEHPLHLLGVAAHLLTLPRTQRVGGEDGRPLQRPGDIQRHYARIHVVPVEQVILETLLPDELHHVMRELRKYVVDLLLRNELPRARAYPDDPDVG